MQQNQNIELSKRINILSWIDITIGVLPVLIFAFTLLIFFSSDQANDGWAALAYFLLIILLAPFLATNLTLNILSFIFLRKNKKVGIIFSLIAKFLALLFGIFILILYNYQSNNFSGATLYISLAVLIIIGLIVFTFECKKEF